MCPYCRGRIAGAVLVGTVRGMAYPSDPTDAQWDLLEPVFNTPGKGAAATQMTCAQLWTRCCPSSLSTRLLVGRLVVPASMHENRASEGTWRIGGPSSLSHRPSPANDGR